MAENHEISENLENDSTLTTLIVKWCKVNKLKSFVDSAIRKQIYSLCEKSHTETFEQVAHKHFMFVCNSVLSNSINLSNIAKSALTYWNN